MAIIVQPASPAADYATIAEMWSRWRGHTLSVNDLHEEDEVQIEGRIRRWLVARDVHDKISGIAYIARYLSNPNT